MNEKINVLKPKPKIDPVKVFGHWINDQTNESLSDRMTIDSVFIKKVMT